MNRLNHLIAGCGYLGLRAARAWLAQGDRVYAITRSAGRAAELTQRGIEPVVANIVDGPLSLPACRWENVLWAVGYDRDPARSIDEVFVRGPDHLVESLQHHDMGRLIYVSSTGVYHQQDGEWVDEDSPTTPIRPGGAACLAAEQRLQSGPRSLQTVILRMAGIYGPGRIPQLAKLQEPLAVPENGWLNLIHVDDAVQVILACGSARPPRTYVVADGEPVWRGDYYRALARLAGCPEPTFAPVDPSAPVSARAASSKRVSPTRMVRELRVVFRFPNYQLGLADCLAS